MERGSDIILHPSTAFATEGGWKTVPIESYGSSPSKRHRQKEDRLHQIPLEKNWPTLSPVVLALIELEQDEMYPLIPEQMISNYLEEAISFGENAARGELYEGDLARLINRVIQSGVKIRFVEREGHDSTGWIRAQYRRKPPTIEIYKPSLKQLGRFFRRSGYHVNPDDLIALHLYHEWFHHLESSSLGRTDHRLPKAEKKRSGPLCSPQANSSAEGDRRSFFHPVRLGAVLVPLVAGPFASALRSGLVQIPDPGSFPAAPRRNTDP